MHTFRVVLVISLLALALALTAIPAVADAVYHSQHIALAPTDSFSFPLRSGFVENIHANGPIVYAHENYVLNGARPNTTFVVHLFIYPGSLDCMGNSLDLTTASLVTNGAGNAKAKAVFAPEAAKALWGLTVSAQWVLMDATTPAYATECSVIVLDSP